MTTWTIKNKTLEFDESTHTYWYDGKKCISVTQFLKRKFSKKYDGIDEETLKKAAEKGTYVHSTIEMYEKYGIESCEIQEFRDYIFLKNAFKFKVKQNEIPIVLEYGDLIIAGRLDLVIEENDKLGLGDIKCTSTFDKEYLTYQLNLYRLGYEQCYNEKIEFLRGIHLKNSKRKYAEIPIKEKEIIEFLEEIKK